MKKEQYKGFKDSKIQGFKDSKIQGFKDSKIQGFKDSKIQGFKDSKIQGFKDSKIQGFKDSKIFPKIGEVQFVTGVAAKYIRISLKPNGIVRVTVPKRASLKEAMAFVETKTDWILKAKARMETHEKRGAVFTPATVFSTQSRQLQLISWKSEQFRSQLTKDTLKIFYPAECNLQSNHIQEMIRNFIIMALRKEAKDYLPQRTELLAAAHGFKYSGVTVKNISSRWGSCSSTNHINLNIHLVRLPEHLSDYVILHELTHTVHKNHSQHFWKHLDTITGGKAKLLAGEMKQYNAGL